MDLDNLPLTEQQTAPQVGTDVFNVNGVLLSPLTTNQRVNQLNHLTNLQEQVDLHHQTTLTTKEQSAELALCMQDFAHFCNFYLWTFDPRQLVKKRVRFLLYDYQVEAAQQIILAINQGHDLLIEKSRDMGASWLMMAVLLWFWLFERDFHALVGSRVEAMVDNYTVDSLFGKLDFMLDHLPDWMKSVVPYNPNDRDCRKQLQLANYDGSLISGESANISFGRGPRKRVVYYDEFASTEYDTAIWTGIADTAPCKIVSSTPKGALNKFYELRNSNQIQVLTFHWTAHPQKTIEWYTHESSRRDVITIAQELDIDYRASGGQLALPQIKLHRNKIIIPPISLDPTDFIFDMGMDYGTTNPSAVGVFARRKTMSKSQLWPDQYCVWEYYEPSNAKKISEALRACPYFQFVRHIWADPSVFYNNQSSDDGKAVTNIAAIFQKYYNITLSSGKRGDAFVLQQLRLMWDDASNISFFIFESCPNAIAEFSGLHYTSQSSNMLQRHNASERLVDKNNHFYDAFKYYFNQTFDAKILEPMTEIKKGYDAFYEEFLGLKQSKLTALTTKPKQGRRVFKWG